MAILKSVIVAELRNRGQHMRADFVDKQLPNDIDPTKHVGLLATLELDAAGLPTATASELAAAAVPAASATEPATTGLPTTSAAEPAGDGPASPGPASPGPASPGSASPGSASNGPASHGPASNGPASPGPASNGPASPGPAGNGSASAELWTGGAHEPGATGFPTAAAGGLTATAVITRVAGDNLRSPLTSTARFRLDPSLSRTTLLDGGWWPRSTDPAAELPAIVEALAERRGAISHLLLNPADWDLPHPRRLTAGGRSVRIGWFASQPAGLLTMICENRLDRVDLLVVPPMTALASANAAMAAAADVNNKRRVPALLADLHETD